MNSGTLNFRFTERHSLYRFSYRVCKDFHATSYFFLLFDSYLLMVHYIFIFESVLVLSGLVKYCTITCSNVLRIQQLRNKIYRIIILGGHTCEKI